jgi:hypothetical protein
MNPSRLAMLVMLAAVAAAGCTKLRDAALKQKTANDLKKLCDLYGAYYSARGHGPESLSDLEPLATGDAEAEAVLEAVRKGRYVLLWGVDVHAVGKTRPGMAFTILGYQREVPESGGMVVMVDGSVVEMKAAKFAASPKGNALQGNAPEKNEPG